MRSAFLCSCACVYLDPHTNTHALTLLLSLCLHAAPAAKEACKTAWFDTLVLDCDGVLVDSERASCEALRRAILEVSVNMCVCEFVCVFLCMCECGVCDRERERECVCLWTVNVRVVKHGGIISEVGGVLVSVCTKGTVLQFINQNVLI